MAFKTNDSQQIRLNDRLNNLTERERRILDKSWAKPFAERIFPFIDETKFACLYCEDNGRPPTPVNVVVGSLLLKEVMRLTDEELLDNILFNTQFQYALHLTSFEEIPYSDRTPSRFRERLYKHELETYEDLLKKEIERLGEEFTKILKINSRLERVDSIMVSSSCKKMGRLELMYTCIANLVKAVVRTGEELLLPEHLLNYTEENRNALCYRLEQEEVQTRLETVAKDALLIFEICGEAYAEFEEYQLLARMLRNQTKDGELKPGKEISPMSLQNPSDKDATFRRKAGKAHHGYVANVVETCSENGNIITAYDYAENVVSDVDLGAAAIEDHGKQAEPLVMVSDGGFSSEENFKAAEENNIILVTTNLTGKTPPEIVTEFQTENDSIIKCPAGHTPIDCTYNKGKEQYRAHFDKAACLNCPRKNECPITIQKKTAVIQLSKNTFERAKYAAKLGTEEYKKYARIRNGVEGIPSVLRRRYGVDNMPVRGYVRSKMWFGFKIGAMNVKRVIAAALCSSSISVFINKICRKATQSIICIIHPTFAWVA